MIPPLNPSALDTDDPQLMGQLVLVRVDYFFQLSPRLRNSVSFISSWLQTIAESVETTRPIIERTWINFTPCTLSLFIAKQLNNEGKSNTELMVLLGSYNRDSAEYFDPELKNNFDLWIKIIKATPQARLPKHWPIDDEALNIRLIEQCGPSALQLLIIRHWNIQTANKIPRDSSTEWILKNRKLTQIALSQPQDQTRILSRLSNKEELE
jgi:hypothetical protein